MEYIGMYNSGLHCYQMWKVQEPDVTTGAFRIVYSLYW